ncbi:MAG: RNA polymerase sigma factor [Acidimicrobiales bacterium]
MGRFGSVVDLDERRVLDAYAAVRRFAFLIADRDIDPDDLVHEAMVRMLSRGSVGAIDDMTAYLRRSVLNIAANQRRSLGRRRRAIDRLHAVNEDHETGDSESSGDLGELMSLEPIDRAVLFLFVVEGRPHREVADLLDMSEDAVRARLSRVLKRLRVEMIEEVGHGNAR